MRRANDTLFGIRIGPRSLNELVEIAEASIASRQEPFILACANPHSLVMARKDTVFRSALANASAVVADGVGCRLAGAMTGVYVGPRITGYDFFRPMMSSLNDSGGRAYFFGSSRKTLVDLELRAQRDFPKVSIATHSPPFGDWSPEENRAMLQDIRDFRPDVLWVGMTAPKQEKWVAENCVQLDVPVVGSIGAVFDFYAGTTRRAPQWVCDLGLEWLYRLPREPTRLWKRTFISAPLFLWFVMLERMRSVSRLPGI